MPTNPELPATNNRRNRSVAVMARAAKHIPGGVNSPVRAFRGVGGTPVVFERGDGAWLYDVDGNAYIDYVGSWGPMLLGHGHPAVLDAVGQRIAQGLGFGAPTEVEAELAELLCEMLPSMAKVRLVNSGTEATMSAIRLARGFTGRELIIKFVGCYHGHVDALLVQAGSGLLTLGSPDSAGVPASVVEHTLVLPYNQLEAAATAFGEYGDRIAAVIVEPVAGNMGCVPPLPGFLESLRQHCTAHGALLIFDEVMTGFRVAMGGAQTHFNVTPDLTTLGKIIGGGLPVGAFGGRAEVMDQLAPDGPVYQAGTLSGNPIAVTAGLATLQQIRATNPYPALAATTGTLVNGLLELGQQLGLPMVANQVGSMFGLFFTEEAAVSDFDGVMRADRERYARYFHAMLDAGVYLAPSAFECGFVSTRHDDPVIAQTLERAAHALRAAASAPSA